MENLFRQEYLELTQEEKDLILSIKGKAQLLFEAYCPEGTVITRELSLAKTKLEESVMWAVKGITGSK